MINPDTLLERLRERVMEPDDYYRGYCGNCNAQLTTADVDADECSNCHSQLSDPEEEYAWYNANGLFNDDAD
jgi:hypothetical protein